MEKLTLQMLERMEKLKNLDTLCSSIERALAQTLPVGVGFALVLVDKADSGGAAMSLGTNLLRESLVRVLRIITAKVQDDEPIVKPIR